MSKLGGGNSGVLLQFGGSFSQSGGMLRIRGYAQNHGGSAHFKISGVVQTGRICSESWGS